MSAGKICNRAVVVIAPDESVREAARRMDQYNVGSLVAVTNHTPIGMLSDRDIVVRCVGGDLDPDENTVSDVMTSPVRSVDEATPIEEALSVMASVKAQRLPVVDERGHLAGIIALDDVLDLLTEEAGIIRQLLERRTPDIPVQ